jgi:ribosomal protein S18 acetylase RimI-like enzyme|tara:strand:- start:3894 stop:4490 length:597 start_codon:yes stop_codon:yes gene_type:complete
MNSSICDLPAETSVERLESFQASDLYDLCDAADAAIVEGGGFGWVKPPVREVMERYWQGILMVPERELIVARLDGVIAGSVQLLKPAPNNESGALCGTLTTFFVAPWARGHGLGLRLVKEVEKVAYERGLEVVNLDVRESQHSAIRMYDRIGYQRWGINPHYVNVKGKWMAGFYYSKRLLGDETQQDRRDVVAQGVEA